MSDDSARPPFHIYGIEPLPPRHEALKPAAITPDNIGLMRDMDTLRKGVALRILRETILDRRPTYLNLIRPQPIITDITPTEKTVYAAREPNADKPPKRFRGLRSYKDTDELRVGAPIEPRSMERLLNATLAAMPDMHLMKYAIVPEYTALRSALECFYMQRAAGDSIKDTLDPIVDATAHILKKVEKKTLEENSGHTPMDLTKLVLERAMDEAYRFFLEGLEKRRKKGSTQEVKIAARLQDSFDELLNIVEKRLEAGKGRTN